MQLYGFNADGQLEIWGRVIGVLTSSDGIGATCILEDAESRTPLLCDMATGDRALYEAAVGQMVTMVGTPHYSRHGRVFKVRDATLTLGSPNVRS
jgi:hypothetical protein